MSDITNAVKELSAAIKEIELPQELLEGYDILECLAHSHGTETYLAQQKGSNKLCIAKCYDKKLYKTVNESGILKALSHKGLPIFINEYHNDTFVCIVREFIKGTPLDKYMDEIDLTEAQAVTLCVKLCNILTYLHGLDPPVIHRDIKPQNIIVKENGEVSLIDFDIARTYDNDANTDTQFMGTRVYAPPEQYGFSQTDARADIYSLGILLCCMLTGDTDVKKAQIKNKRLAAAVRRCAAFSPEERFSDAAAVKKALLDADSHNKKRSVRTCGTVLIVLLALLAGFAVGRYTGFFAPATIVEQARFAEPLIERAVRIQLGKDETTPITNEELLCVREIYIFGDEVSKTQEPFSEGLGGRLGDTPRGGMTTLEDVKLLPNLEVLYVNYQMLTDISPVAELKYLTAVSLRSTFVEDISALSGMQQLGSVCLFDTHVADMSPLDSCAALYSLDVGKTPIASLSELNGITGLRVLSLRQTQFSSLDGIERFALLEKLDLCRSQFTDLSPLLSLKSLSEVSVDVSMRGVAEALENPPFEIKYE